MRMDGDEQPGMQGAWMSQGRVNTPEIEQKFEGGEEGIVGTFSKKILRTRRPDRRYA